MRFSVAEGDVTFGCAVKGNTFWYLMLVFVHSNISAVYGEFLNRLTKDLITSFLTVNHVSFAVVVNCGVSEDMKIAKFLSSKGIPMCIHKAGGTMDVSSLLSVDNYRLAVILDWQCEGSGRFLKKASKQRRFTILHFWLLISLNDDHTANTSLKSNSVVPDLLTSTLESIYIPVDSHFYVARDTSDPSHVFLQDVYKVLSDSPLVLTPLRNWSISQPFSFGPIRDDFGGFTFETATPAYGQDFDAFKDAQYRHVNSFAKFVFSVTEIIAEMFNFSIHVSSADSCGYITHPGAGANGVIGMLHREEIQMTSCGIMLNSSYLDYLDYSGEIHVYETAFIFMRPSLSDISNIYVQSFSARLWLAYFLVMVAFTAVFYAAQKEESKLYESEGDELVTVSDSLMSTVAIVCQEGTTRDPKTFSSRIVFLSVLLLSLFVSTSYSANIVSLLQTTSSRIQTLRDLLDGPFTFSMKDSPYHRNYYFETTDSDIRRVYKDCLYTQPDSIAFTSSEIGAERIRSGLDAYHGDVQLFTEILRTYEEHEKCKLKEIPIFKPNTRAFGVPKGSPHREHITRGVLRLSETGLTDRNYKMWNEEMPKCRGNAEWFASVRLQDFYPTLLIFACGALISVGILILENLHLVLSNCKSESKFKKM